MTDLQVIADRVEIEALRGEFTDAANMRDYDRLAMLFTRDGAWQMPDVPADLLGQEQIRAWGQRVPALVDFLVQNTHPGTIQFDGDIGSGRAYMHEVIRLRDGGSYPNFVNYHDRYQRTPTAGNSPSVSTRSGTSTPVCWQVRCRAQRAAERSVLRPGQIACRPSAQYIFRGPAWRATLGSWATAGETSRLPRRRRVTRT